MSRTKKSKANDQRGYEITEEDFNLFVREGKYWQKFFGLLDWEIIYVLAASRDHRAWCSVGELKDRVAEIGLAHRWEIQPTDKQIRRTVFHEIVELLTMRLYILAISRDASYQNIVEENHKIIRALENSVFEEDYKRRFRE